MCARASTRLLLLRQMSFILKTIWISGRKIENLVCISSDFAMFQNWRLRMQNKSVENFVRARVRTCECYRRSPKPDTPVGFDPKFSPQFSMATKHRSAIQIMRKCWVRSTWPVRGFANRKFQGL